MLGFDEIRTQNKSVFILSKEDIGGEKLYFETSSKEYLFRSFLLSYRLRRWGGEEAGTRFCIPRMRGPAPRSGALLAPENPCRIVT
jgi:hypothetical protein